MGPELGEPAGEEREISGRNEESGWLWRQLVLTAGYHQPEASEKMEKNVAERLSDSSWRAVVLQVTVHVRRGKWPVELTVGTRPS